MSSTFMTSHHRPLSIFYHFLIYWTAPRAAASNLQHGVLLLERRQRQDVVRVLRGVLLLRAELLVGKPRGQLRRRKTRRLYGAKCVNACSSTNRKAMRGANERDE
jgi:hypothetical protein